MLKVLAVCVNGMGSSLILRMTAEKAFKELGIEANVKAIDLGQLKGMRGDMFITSPSLAKSIQASQETKIVTVTNYTDVKTLKEKIRLALAPDEAEEPHE
ncbi:MAG: PTS sugar transporter subunit IIB [Crenarchaeota archaeon]|nr:PTS sugar transporter subunit IIB [Thermoproteota archaeon]